MSYVGYINTLCRNYFNRLSFPKVLEIGVDYGQTAVPLIHNIAYCDNFIYVGVDIKLRSELIAQLSSMRGIALHPMDECCGRDVALVEANSLEWLPNQSPEDVIFDAVFIDGDHNYQTVSQELKLIQPLLHSGSLIICDDYQGAWSESDLYYSERDDYAENELATPKEISEKQGVKSAVEDFLRENKNWSGFLFPEYEPIILYRKDFWHPLISKLPEGVAPGQKALLRDIDIVFERRTDETTVG